MVDARPTAIEMRLVSPDGDQGHPGRLDARARFSLEPSRDGLDRVHIVYQATTDRPTHANIVAHPYFNLAGDASSVLDHQLTIAATSFLPIRDDNVPTGEIASVAGTPFDFRRAHAIGERIDKDDLQLRIGDGYNHNFALAGTGLREVAWLRDPASGRAMSVATDQPGLQLYTANALERAQRQCAVCLETQGWPDAANHPHFPSTRIDPGMTYRSETVLRFTAG